jgi:hypothetical protein
MRADDFVLLRFNHDGIEFRELGDFSADDLFWPDSAQIVMALLTLLDLHADGPSGIVDQFSHRSLVAKGRTVLFADRPLDCSFDRALVVEMNSANWPAAV